MKLLLIRHADKAERANVADGDAPLSTTGKHATWQRGDALARMEVRPTLFLTSAYKHAAQTANILAAQLNGGSRPTVLTLQALTPHSDAWSFAELCDEARSQGARLGEHPVIAVVGHEPRLSRLITELTGARFRPLDRGEVVCLDACTLHAFFQGQGKLVFRLPVANFQESKLRGKVQSKMTVSSLLAGFAFAVLIELLLNSQLNARPFLATAIICLTAALGLLIAALYMYDVLAMPEGFWLYGDRPQRFGKAFHDDRTKYGLLAAYILSPWRYVSTWAIGRGKQFQNDHENNGLLYALMIWTWKFVFTPAVFLGLLGFLAVLINTQNMAVIAGGIVIILAVFGYYLLARPRLGTD